MSANFSRKTCCWVTDLLLSSIPVYALSGTEELSGDIMSQYESAGLISSRLEGMLFFVETADKTESYDSQFLVAALLLSVAKSDGEISEIEIEKMLLVVSDYFRLNSSESLDLLSRALKELAEDPDLAAILRGWSTSLTAENKEDIVLMMLKVVAADGKQGANELKMVNTAADLIDISPESLHMAFNRYFDESAGN